MQHAMYCENGHRVAFIDPETGERDIPYAYRLNETLETWPLPKFCAECSAKTMSKCHGCSAYIVYNDAKVHYVPSYCTECGQAYPWTSERLKEVSEYTDELDLSDEEKRTLKTCYPYLTRETPKTEIAIDKFKRVYSKVAPPAAAVIRSVLINVLTDGAKHKLGW